MFAATNRAIAILTLGLLAAANLISAAPVLIRSTGGDIVIERSLGDGYEEFNTRGLDLDLRDVVEDMEELEGRGIGMLPFSPMTNPSASYNPTTKMYCTDDIRGNKEHPRYCRPWKV